MKHRVARALVGLGAVALMVGGAAIPAGAQEPMDPELLPTLEVVKVVEGDAPADGIYTVEVSCADFEEVDGTGGSEGDGFVAYLEFNADGSPHRAPAGWDDTDDSWILAESWDLKKVTCTVSELAGGAATNATPSYDCAFSNEQWVDPEVNDASYEEGPEPGCLATDPAAIVRLGSPWDRSCIPENSSSTTSKAGCTYCVQDAVVTVTNTFPVEPEPEAAAPAAVVVTPKFTG